MTLPEGVASINGGVWVVGFFGEGFLGTGVFSGKWGNKLKARSSASLFAAPQKYAAPLLFHFILSSLHHDRNR